MVTLGGHIKIKRTSHEKDPRYFSGPEQIVATLSILHELFVDPKCHIYVYISFVMGIVYLFAFYKVVVELQWSRFNVTILNDLLDRINSSHTIGSVVVELLGKLNLLHFGIFFNLRTKTMDTGHSIVTLSTSADIISKHIYLFIMSISMSIGKASSWLFLERESSSVIEKKNGILYKHILRNFANLCGHRLTHCKKVMVNGNSQVWHNHYRYKSQASTCVIDF